MKLTLADRNIQKVLIRGVNWIGDTLITFPAIKGIREIFNDVHCTVLIKPHLSSLYEQCAFVDEIIPYPKGGSFDLIHKERKLVKDIAQKKFDLAVILPRSFRSALVPYFARIPYRVGYSASGRGMFLTHGLKEDAGVLSNHQVEYYYRLARSLGAPSTFDLPVLTVDKEDVSWAKTFLENAGIDEHKLLIGINPGSTYGSAKCWFPERYLELAQRLASNAQAAIMLVGGKDNLHLINHIASKLDGQIVKAVGEDLLHLAALVRRCRLFITNDTGPMHIASAVGVPVVAIFGSTNPVTTSPLGEGHCVIRREVDCSCCLKRECPEDHRCMRLISVDEVERAVMKQLNGTAV